MKNQQAQGDILVYPIDSLPDGVKKATPKNGRWILAEGEATGHHHSIAADSNVTVYIGDDGSLFAQVDGTSVELTHQEHATITIQPGYYQIRPQFEYDPFIGFRKVID